MRIGVKPPVGERATREPSGQTVGQPTPSRAAKGQGQDKGAFLPDFARWMEVPTHTTEASTEASKQRLEAVADAIKKGSAAGSLEKAVEHYEGFLERYPRGPGSLAMMNRLGCTYARIGRTADARRMLEAAIALAGDDRYANTIEINMAFLEMTADDLDAAEARLRRIMDKPIPESMDDPYAVAPQLFTSRKFLARAYEQRGDLDGAARLLEEATERGLELIKANPRAEWLPSYVRSTYSHRVDLVFKKDPENIAEARRLADDFLARLPNPTRGRCSYHHILKRIVNQERKLRGLPPLMVLPASQMIRTDTDPRGEPGGKPRREASPGR